MERFDTFTATFQPQRTDDLKPGVERAIGRRFRWQAAWVIGGEDTKYGVSADYIGMFACALLDEDEDLKGLFVWVPEGDLADVEPVERLVAT